MRLPLSDLVTRRWEAIRHRPARRSAITAATAAVALAAGLTVAAAGGQSASATGQPAYLNPRLPVQARVADLLGRMTLPEKIGQMVQIEATQVTDTSPNCTSTGGFNMPNPVCEQKIFVTDNVGSILAGRTDETWAEEPALAAAMGGAFVRGLQSIPGQGLRVTATVKHFAGYSESIN